MHVISVKKIRDFVTAGHADAEAPLMAWYAIAKSATWTSIVNVRLVFPYTDPVGKHTVFNIKGGTYRLIAEIYYPNQVLLVRHILTHADYDKDGWK